MVYCTPAQMFFRYDLRFIANLLSDTGVPIAQGSLATNANLLDILAQASSELKMAVRQGRKYEDLLLDKLYSDPNTSVQLYSLVADYAFGVICARRGMDVPKELATRYEESLRKIEDLRNGIKLFDDPTHAQAGVSVVLENSFGPVNCPPVVWSAAAVRYLGLPWQ